MAFNQRQLISQLAKLDLNIACSSEKKLLWVVAMVDGGAAPSVTTMQTIVNLVYSNFTRMDPRIYLQDSNSAEIIPAVINNPPFYTQMHVLTYLLDISPSPHRPAS